VLTAGTLFPGSQTKSVGCHLARDRVHFFHPGHLSRHHRVQGTLPSQADRFTLYFGLGESCSSRRCVCFVGLGGPAKRKSEALFARAWVKWRDCVVAIDTACTITQHLVVYVARFAMIMAYHSITRVPAGRGSVRTCVIRRSGRN
jgi:hypothetical protein